MGIWRWYDLKAVRKLCHYKDEKKRTEPDYDPAQKYRKVWDITVHNLNKYFKEGGLDLAIDETTWANAGYANIQGRMRGKKVSKGSQHTLAVDALSRYVYVYTPRHSRFTRTTPFKQEGPAEVKRLLDQLIPLVRGREKDEGDLRR